MNISRLGSRVMSQWIQFRHQSAFYCLYHRIRFPDFVVKRSSRLVIEGYPRCANSYAEALLSASLDDKINSQFHFAHHVHSLAHVRLAVRYGVPTVVLFREARDAVISQYLLASGSWPMELLLSEYCIYYSGVLELIDSVTVIEFSKLTQNPRHFVEVAHGLLNEAGELENLGLPSPNQVFARLNTFSINRVGEAEAYTDKGKAAERARRKEAAREE